jgi:hypothetical protein
MQMKVWLMAGHDKSMVQDSRGQSLIDPHSAHLKITFHPSQVPAQSESRLLRVEAKPRIELSKQAGQSHMQ